MIACPAETESLSAVLSRLDEIAPGVPLLALGQTVFWDEPMKALVAQAAPDRRFIAGVHDTDFFAKLPSGSRGRGAFRTVPHNDTTTRGLWSAAAEFSTLFGSETVVTRDMLQAAGVPVGRMEAREPGFLDRATEAWGWRGIVSLDESPPLTSEVPAISLLPELLATLGWAMDGALAVAPGADHAASELRARVAEACATGSLADAYERLAPQMYGFAAGASVPVETDRTSHLLRFNRETCGRPRFSLARLFIESSTRPTARASYDEALREKGSGTGQYELARFGTGAIPFDLVVPGHGRGVVRLGTRGAVIGTRTPLFLSFKRPVESLEEFAAAVEAKFGPECALIGKAVTLVGMLAAEHVFVFHEGASGYVGRSAKLHALLCQRLHWCQHLNPILRVRYQLWDALAAVDRDLNLPEPLRESFGAAEITAHDLSARMEGVDHEARDLRARLGSIRRPVDLLALLAERDTEWRMRGERYRELQGAMEGFQRRTGEGRLERQRLYARRQSLKARRVATERAMGVQFRTEIFEADPGLAALARRRELTERRARVLQKIEENARALRELLRVQGEAARDPEIRAVVAERREIEAAAEVERTRLVREAVLASDGLEHAALRPSAWWLPLVSPDGAWFRETARTAAAYLEPLRPVA